jgi:hypothetical protein
LQVTDLRWITLYTHGSEKARREITTDPHEALKAFTQLRNLANEFSSRNEKAWGSMIYLTEYVESSTRLLWDDMEEILSVYVPKIR